jgi:hypothetical protein
MVRGAVSVRDAAKTGEGVLTCVFLDLLPSCHDCNSWTVRDEDYLGVDEGASQNMIDCHYMTFRHDCASYGHD